MAVNISDYQLGGAKYQAYRRAYQEDGNQALFRGLGGSTSDHAYRMIEVQTDAASLRVATFNMLNRAKVLRKTDDINTSTFNNPFHTFETQDEYIARKRAQMLWLVNVLTAPVACDVVFLQEPDWAFDPVLKNEVDEILAELDYGMIVTPIHQHQKSLVTIYNQTLLQHDPNHDTGMFPYLHQHSKHPENRAFKTYFTYLPTDECVILINAHMMYGKDIITAQTVTEALTQDPHYLTIMGQDLNQVFDINTPYYILDRRASVVSSRPCAYDGFFVRPAEGQSVKTQIIGGEYITLNENGEGVNFHAITMKENDYA